MRVAYLINQYPKVSHTFIRREILALERQGFDVTRIAIRGWDGDLVDDEDKLERERTRYVLRDGAPSLLLAFTRMLSTRPVALMRAVALAWTMSRRAERPFPIHLIYVAEACCIARWLDQAGIQHLHAHFGTNSAEVAMLAHILGGPHWSFTVHGPEEFDKAPVIGLAEKIRRSAFVVAISSYGRSQLYRLVGPEYWPKVHVVHCGLEPAFYAGDVSPPTAARRLVCVGRLCEQKGQLLLVEAAHRLEDRGVDFELVLAGDGEMRGDIEALIARYHLQARVRILGWISGDQVRDEMLAARALVLPSFAEGLPVVIMEAMALGRPVITTLIAGIPELVRSGEHGWLVPAGDVSALADAIQACLDAAPEALAQMGAKAREQALTRHDIDTEEAKLAALFEEAGEPVMSNDLASKSREFLQTKDIHASWESDYLNPDMDKFYNLAFDDILERLAPTTKSSILDAGCGYCYHTVRLAKSGAKITAADFSEAALKSAQQTIDAAGIADQVTLLQADLTALPFPDSSFDCVISWGVLMHIPQMEKALSELARVLKPGGTLVLCENNMRSLDVRVRERSVDFIKKSIGRNIGEKTDTPRGTETWLAGDGGGLMMRKTDMDFLVGFMSSIGLSLIERIAGQFSEVYTNLPLRPLKRLAYAFNEFYFRRKMPASLAMGNILYFRKPK